MVSWQALYFHPATKIENGKPIINTERTSAIFLGEAEYDAINAKNQSTKILLPVLMYISQDALNPKVQSTPLFRLEFNRDLKDVRYDLIPLFVIDRENKLYLRIIYLEGMLKYYVSKLSNNSYNFFQEDISETLPLLNNAIETLIGEEEKPVAILDDEESKWYSAHSDPDKIKYSINLLIGAVDYTVLDQTKNAYIYENGQSYQLNNRALGDQSISISSINPTTSEKTVAFKASIDIGTSTGISIDSGNKSPLGLFYSCNITGGSGENVIRGIKIDTSIVTDLATSPFQKLIARINFINKLLGYTPVAK